MPSIGPVSLAGGALNRFNDALVEVLQLINLEENPAAAEALWKLISESREVQRIGVNEADFAETLRERLLLGRT